MATYKYTAVNDSGKEEKGTLQADTVKSAKQMLREQSLIPVEVEDIVHASSSQYAHRRSTDKKISVVQLSLFTEELSSLLGAGLELEESLHSVAVATEQEKFKHIILGVHAKIIEGFTFAQGLNEYPKAFPKIYRATVQAGEEAGYLAQVLGNLAGYLENQNRIRQRIKQALIYPCILSFVSIAIVIFLLTYVSPKIIGIYTDSEQTLPWATIALIKISDFLVDYGMILAGAIVVAFIIFKHMLKLHHFKFSYHKLLLSLPFIGRTIKSIQTSRFLRALGILTQSRVPILKAMNVSSNLVSSLPIQEKLLDAMNMVKEGGNIYLSFKNTRYFSPICLQFIASGERSGELDKMLMHAAEQQERQVQITLDVLLTLFEPFLILLMGCIVLFIVLAILLPMFEISNLIV